MSPHGDPFRPDEFVLRRPDSAPDIATPAAALEPDAPDRYRGRRRRPGLLAQLRDGGRHA